MEYILSTIWSTFEIVSILLVSDIFLFRRYDDKKTKILAAFLCFGSVAILLAITYFLSCYSIIGKGISVIFIAVLLSVIFKAKWYLYFIISVLCLLAIYFLDNLIGFGTAYILNISFSDLVWKKKLYSIIVTMDKSIVLLLSCIIHFNLKNKTANRLSVKELLLLLLFPAVSLFLMYLVFLNYRMESDLNANAVLFSIILILSDFLAVYLMLNINRAEKAEHELAILNKSMALQSEGVKALEKRYRVQREAAHEFNHQLRTIGELLNNGEIAEAAKYLNVLQQKQTERIYAVISRHPIIDALLNEKYTAAKERKINISFKVNDLSGLKISTDSLVVLLSNLMDNAIEACTRIPEGREREIECTLLLDENFYLSIRNTSMPVVIKNNSIETSKEPKEEHGFGLTAVKRILNELDAEYVMEYENGYFQFAAEIPIK